MSEQKRKKNTSSLVGLIHRATGYRQGEVALRSKVEQEEVLVARFGGRTSVWLVQGLSPSRHRSSSPCPGPHADPLGLSLHPSMHRPLMCSIWKKRHPSHKPALSPYTKQHWDDDDRSSDPVHQS